MKDRELHEFKKLLHGLPEGEPSPLPEKKEYFYTRGEQVRLKSFLQIMPICDSTKPWKYKDMELDAWLIPLLGGIVNVEEDLGDGTLHITPVGGARKHLVPYAFIVDGPTDK